MNPKFSDITDDIGRQGAGSAGGVAGVRSTQNGPAAGRVLSSLETIETLLGPSRVELVAVDLDGTLLDAKGQVAPRTRDAVRGVRSATGIPVAIATGRTWWEARSIIEQASLTGPGVFAGGAVVNDMSSGKTLAKTTLDPITAMEVCAIVEACGLPAMVLQDNRGHGAEFLVSDGIEIPRSLADWWTYHQHDIELRRDLGAVPHDGTLRVTTAATPESMLVVGARLQELLAGRCSWHCIRVPAYGVEVLEVFHPSVNKWHGLVQLSALAGIDAGRIVAIGDDVNDLAMLSNAMLGVAMGNAYPAAREAADMNIGPNTEDGLARFLEELVMHGSRRSLKGT